MAIRSINHRRSRRWCFTLNNPSDDRIDDPKWWVYRFVFWQKEQAPTTDTPHLQGFVVWNDSKSLASCKRQNPRCHWEPMRKSITVNIAYCSKSETKVDGPWQHGVKPHPGKRNDIYDVQDMLLKGKSMLKIANRHFPVFVKFHRGMEKYQLLITPPRNARPQIFIFWGRSGIGKTRLVRDTFPQAWFKPKSKWWDSYNSHDVVVFDEFYSWISFDNLLRILDWYPLVLETKGGCVQYTTSVHVFTSNTDPRTWYSQQPNSRREALFRRFIQFGTVMCWNEDENEFEVDDLTGYHSTML